MPAMAKDAYLDPYRRATRAFGSDFAVTLWASERTQQRRFEVFTEMAFLAGKRILDAGCSRGDFHVHLLAKNIRVARFIGVDGLPDVIEYARGRNLPDAEFHAGDFVTDPALLKIGDPQIITISGTMNTMDPATAQRLLESAWDAASEALLFNFLSDRVSRIAPPQGYPAVRLPTMALLDWAFSKTPIVNFRQDYFPGGHDASILMQREDPRNVSASDLALQ
jgi:SAM-dependent methyltransferase